ncbi:MAG: site-specific recombinase [Actinomycetota bacterium]|jgi:hypothetical protein|nr:site-specific recombinase [Actinomycetota bacterium]
MTIQGCSEHQRHPQPNQGTRGDLVAQVTITAPDRLIPVFRIPQPHNTNGAATALPAETTPKGMVRTMTKSVELLRRYSNRPDLTGPLVRALRGPLCRFWHRVG